MTNNLVPPHLKNFSIAWDFQPTIQMPSGHCSQVIANKTHVLKVPLRGEELTSGFHANIALAKIGGPKVYASDPRSKATLMQRLTPGTLLADAPQEQDLEIFIRIAKRCRKMDPTQFTPLHHYFKSHTPLITWLLNSTNTPTPLHGDLHHSNIIKHQKTWKPIDPKGLFGDPAYECTAFLRNPFPLFNNQEVATQTTIHRINVLQQKLKLDPYRIAAWFLADRSEDKDLPPDHPWQVATKVATLVEQHFRPKNQPNLQKPLY